MPKADSGGNALRESLVRTLSGGRAPTGPKEAGLELSLMEPAPPCRPDELVAVVAVPAETGSTVVLAASEYRPHPAFELAENIPTESIDLTDTILGQGRFGVVREGLMADAHGRRVRVAVKMLVGVNPGERGAFEQEVRVLQHVAGKCSNVCRLYGTCWLENSLCIVMKQYSMSLATLMDSTPERKLPLRRAVQLISQVIVGLAELHEQRVIVHDLKPSNVLIDEYGQPVIADFGVSTVCETQSVYMPTHAGAMKGTFNYMCAEAFDPEQFGGVTSAADIWSVGCSLLEMLTGKAPWEGLSQPVIMNRVLIKNEHPQIETHIPPALQATLRKCFAITPTERPTARDLVVELQRYQDNLPYSEGETPLSDLERRKIEWVRQDLGMAGLTSDKPITEAEQMSFARAVADKLGFSVRGSADSTATSTRDTLLQAERVLLRQTVDLISSEANPFRGGYFLSHNQGKSGPAVMRLKGRMEVACPKLKGKLWYDKDNIPTEDEMRLGIKRCTFFLLFLSAEVLLRPFVRKEIYWAIFYGKKIVLVWEQEGENAVGSFGTFFEDCAKEVNGQTLNDVTGDLFGQNVAIPYFNDEDFGAVSLAQILREGGYDSEAAALLVPRPISIPTWVIVNFVYSPANGEGQAMSIKNELEEICPSLWGRISTQDEQLTPMVHLMVFVTAGVFSDDTVQTAMANAIANGNSVTMIVETDVRHGGAQMDSLRSVPSKLLADAPSELLPVVQNCTVVPFYKDRAYRRVALTKVLLSVAQTRLQDDAPPVIGTKDRIRNSWMLRIVLVPIAMVFALVVFAFSGGSYRGHNLSVSSQKGCAHDIAVEALSHVEHQCGATGSTLPSGTECSVNCIKGYRGDKEASLQQTTRQCTDGSWSGLLPNCHAEACLSTDSPTGSSLTCTGSTGDRCELRCNKGYKQVGSSFLTCRSDHVFSGSGSCEDVDECASNNGGCSDVEICQNTPGSHSCQNCIDGFTRGFANSTEVDCSPRCVEGGQGLTKRCAFPFSYAGKTYNDCTSEHLPGNIPPGSTWCSTGPNPSDYSKCIDCSTAIACPQLRDPPHGNFACTAQSAAFATRCDLTCPSGYAYRGPSVKNCAWTGSWTPSETSECDFRCTDTGAVCQFPFQFNGVEYNDCTDIEGPRGTVGSLWCATGEDARVQHANCVPCENVDCGDIDGGETSWQQKHFSVHCNSSLYTEFGTCQAQCDAGYSGQQSSMVATCAQDYEWHWLTPMMLPPDCQLCQAGTYAGTGSTSCTKCSPGQYDDDLDPATPCKVCPPGSETSGFATSDHTAHSTGATVCTQCEVGKFTASSATGCQVCYAGHVTDTMDKSGATTCIACDPGMYSTKVGHVPTPCQACPAGHVTDTKSASGASKCNACESGQSSSAPTVECARCEAGKYAAASGATVCSACNAGSETGGFDVAETNEKSTGATTCTQCLVGRFSTSSARGCENCPADHVTNTGNASGATSCTACAPGKFTPSSTESCSDCPPGSYAGDGTCTACTAGQFSPEPSVPCTACTRGQYNSGQPNGGATRCVQCESGSATNALTGSTACVACQLGKYSPESSTPCAPCEHGKSASSVGSTSCVSCIQLHGIDCGAHGDCTGTNGACVCTEGYSGDRCQYEPCHSMDCGLHATCEVDPSTHLAYCKCGRDALYPCSGVYCKFTAIFECCQTYHRGDCNCSPYDPTFQPSAQCVGAQTQKVQTTRLDCDCRYEAQQHSNSGR